MTTNAMVYACLFGFIGLYLLACVWGYLVDQKKTLTQLLGVWEFGECRGWVAKRNSLTGAVYFLVYDQYRNPHWYRFRMRYWREFELSK